MDGFVADYISVFSAVFGRWYARASHRPGHPA